MNNQANREFPSADTVLSVLLVGGLTLASALFVATQSVQVLAA